MKTGNEHVGYAFWTALSKSQADTQYKTKYMLIVPRIPPTSTRRVNKL